MIKQLKNHSTLLIAVLLLVAACKDTNTGTDPSQDVPEIYTSLPGTLISTNTTWDQDQTLTGQYYVLPGVTLTIEPGVTVSFEYHNLSLIHI